MALDAAHVDAAPPACGRGCGAVAWTEAAGALPGVRDHHTTAIYAGATERALLVFGGIQTDALGGASSVHAEIFRAPIGADGTLATFEAETIALPFPLAFHAMAQLGSRLYLVGGIRTAPTGVVSSRAILVVELDEAAHVQRVRECGELPAGAMHPSAEIVGDQLYVLGGRRGDPVVDVWRAPIAADGCTETPQPAPALPETRSHHASVVYDEHIYVLGGFGAGDRARTTVLRSEHAGNGVMLRWDPVGELDPAPWTSSALLVDGALWLVGGGEGSGFFASFVPRVRRAMLGADGTLGAWVDVDAALPLARAHVHQTPMLDGRIYSVGGRIFNAAGEMESTDRVFVGALTE